MAVKQLMLPANRAFDSNGFPEAGATVKLYASGTTTPANFYADTGLTISLGSTLTANAAGRLVTTAYQSDTTAFRLKVFDAAGNELDDIDPFYFGSIYGTLSSTASSNVATRADMAAIVGVANAVVNLTEAGREGTFVFSSANLATKVAADTAQGIYVAPVTDTTGASGAWVRVNFNIPEAEFFGVKGDGTTDDTAALNTAVVTVGALGINAIRLKAGKTYLTTNGTVLLNVANLVVDAYGATLSSPTTGFTKVLNVAAAGTVINGLTVRMTGVTGDPSPYVEINASCKLNNVAVYGANTGHIPFYVKASGFEWRGGGLYNSRGINCFDASNLKFLGITISQGSTASNDDAISIKAHSTQVTDVQVTGCNFINCGNFVAIGSDVGTFGAPDPTYSVGVSNVSVTNNVGDACTSILWIKPGGIDGSSYDYRDGTVENITCENNVLRDTNGTFFNAGLIIRPGRGSRVRNVYYRSNIVEARSLSSGSRVAGVADIYIVDFSATYPGTAAPSVSNIEIDGTFYDPYNGVPNDGTHPGTPVGSFATIEKQTVGHGTASNIMLSVVGNGSSLHGISVQAGFDNAVHIRRARLTNFDTNGSSSFAGINTLSAITIGPEINMTAAGGSAGVQYKTSGAGTITSLLPPQIAANSLIGNNTASIAGAAALTAAQAKTLLAIGAADVSGLATVATSGSATDLTTGTLSRPVATTGGVTSSGTNGVGYAIGAGGAVTQLTSKSTGVTLNKTCGQITMNNAALLNGNVVAFVVTNSTVAATDNVVVTLASGAASNIAYRYWVSTVAAGSFTIVVENRTGGSLSENLVFNFAVIKGVAS